MQGSNVFTEADANEIKHLLQSKVSAKWDEQKRIRKKLRDKYRFYISDFSNPDNKSGAEFYNDLLRRGAVKIIETNENLMSSCSAEPSVTADIKDECYVINLCDQILGERALRQHCFDFLRGVTGKMLPIDAYYAELNLVIEYHEKQHSESVSFFDHRLTASGVNRGEQRRQYDERRRTVLPQHGITLIEICYSELKHSNQKRLTRDKELDMEVLKGKLRLLKRREFEVCQGDQTGK
jgi:hypothetical protein